VVEGDPEGRPSVGNTRSEEAGGAAASVAADLRTVGEHLHDLDEGDTVARGVFLVVLVELDRVDAHVASMSYKVR
jgi:hypothetical protein